MTIILFISTTKITKEALMLKFLGFTPLTNTIIKAGLNGILLNKLKEL
jgi:hypothetical protein